MHCATKSTLLNSHWFLLRWEQWQYMMVWTISSWPNWRNKVQWICNGCNLENSGSFSCLSKAKDEVFVLISHLPFWKADATPTEHLSYLFLVFSWRFWCHTAKKGLQLSSLAKHPLATLVFILQTLHNILFIVHPLSPLPPPLHLSLHHSDHYVPHSGKAMAQQESHLYPLPNPTWINPSEDRLFSMIIFIAVSVLHTLFQREKTRRKSLVRKGLRTCETLLRTMVWKIDH